MSSVLLIHERDSVAVATRDLAVGEEFEVAGARVAVQQAVPLGHKVAIRAHATGELVRKYGYPIGRALAAIRAGEHVHSHNLASALSSELSLQFEGRALSTAAPLPRGFSGYRRADGRVGTRNELWVIPTVGCVARTAEALAQRFRERLPSFPHVEGVHAFSHPFGCSQLGDDLQNTQKILARLATHPNAGGTLVIGLGCENNHLAAFEPFLGAHDASRIRFLSAQSVEDEFDTGLSLLTELALRAECDTRVAVPAASLSVGLKCGGSDGFSGVTANPLLGRFASRLAESGGTLVLSEVPEMFGAESAFFQQCVDAEVFERALRMVSGFRRYFTEHGQSVYENPSPGNKAGGITTLEEKSLGCVQKGGDAPIRDVIAYGGVTQVSGLSLLQGPGNDAVSSTALVAAGATLLLFTTGRGTPLGSPVPTLKVSTQSALFQRKPGWIDFDAGVLLHGACRDAVDDAFEELVLDVASGARTRNEEHGQRDIAIFKDGVTL